MSGLIVVDIQESYKKEFTFSIGDFLQYLYDFQGPVLYLYNGESVGIGGDPKHWLLEEAEYAEFDYLDFRNRLESIEFVDKGYAFFRDAMDSGWSHDDIISLVKLMFDADVNMASDLDREEIEKMTSLSDDEIDELEGERIMVGLPGIEETLIGWDGSTLIGGARGECLTEVTLLLDAMSYSYTLDNRFIY